MLPSFRKRSLRWVLLLHNTHQKKKTRMLNHSDYINTFVDSGEVSAIVASKTSTDIVVHTSPAKDEKTTAELSTTLQDTEINLLNVFGQ